MNFVPVTSRDGQLDVAGRTLAAPRALPQGALKLGVRPEYLALAAADSAGALPAEVVQAQDIGTHVMLTAKLNGTALKAKLAPDASVPAVGSTAWLRVLGEHTCFFANEELVP